MAAVLFQRAATHVAISGSMNFTMPYAWPIGHTNPRGQLTFTLLYKLYALPTQSHRKTILRGVSLLLFLLFSCCCSWAFLVLFSMAASVDPLVVGRVIGDVIDMFVPAINMSVYYGSKHVSNGCEIKPSLAVNPPKVTISGHSDELYTMVRF